MFYGANLWLPTTKRLILLLTTYYLLHQAIIIFFHLCNFFNKFFLIFWGLGDKKEIEREQIKVFKH